MNLIYIIAVAPTVLILIYIMRFDKYQKEPLSLLIKLFAGGMLSVIPAIFLELIAGNIHEYLFGGVVSVFSLIVQAFLGVAIIEEAVKLFFARLFSFRNRAFDELYDGIIYCVIVSLGFATVENVMYVAQYGVSTAIVRAVTAVPAHAIFGVSMGYFMALGRFNPSKSGTYRLLSLIVPTVLHGIYDAILFLQLDWGLLIFLPYILFLYMRAIKLIKSTSDIPPMV